MNTAINRRLRTLTCLLLLASGGACGQADSGEPADGDGRDADEGSAANDPPMSDQARVCSDCTRSSPGGETTDFGSQSACASAYLRREIAAAEADELGFAASVTAQVMEQAIDAPMTWQAQTTAGGGPASGYEMNTRVHGSITVRSFTYLWLDPERCDGTRCTLQNGTSTEQDLCEEPLAMVNASGELATLDGAVSATFPEQAVRILRPGERPGERVSEDDDDLVDVSVAANADLHEVRGSLRIDPAVPQPWLGRLVLSLHFANAEQDGFGVLDVGVYPDRDNRGEDAAQIPSELSSYRPLKGSWRHPP